MKRLNVIAVVLKSCKWLIAGGALFATVFFLFMDKGEMMNIGSSSISIKDKSLEDKINRTLQNETGAEVFIADLDMEMPLDDPLRVAIILAILLVCSYLFFILNLILKIVQDVKKRESFRHINILRLKRLALLFILAPVLSSLLHAAFTLFMEYNYSLPDSITYRVGAEFEFSILIIGLLIYVIAAAFEQGLKMKEEQDLTI